MAGRGRGTWLQDTVRKICSSLSKQSLTKWSLGLEELCQGDRVAKKTYTPYSSPRLFANFIRDFQNF